MNYKNHFSHVKNAEIGKIKKFKKKGERKRDILSLSFVSANWTDSKNPS
jgi:hypothetical protein